MRHPAKTARLHALHRHAARLEARLMRLEAVDNRFFWLRLGALAGGAVALFLSLLSGVSWLPSLVLILSILAFGVVVAFHRRLDRTLARFRISHRHTAEQIARMELDWSHLSPQPQASPLISNESASSDPPAAHPFAGDLNLTGPRSLHTLLDTSAAVGGSLRLRHWLYQPLLDPVEIRLRQEMVHSLVERPGFRNHLAMHGYLAAGKDGRRWDGESLLDWLNKLTEKKNFLPLLITLSSLALVTLILVGLQTFLGFGPWWMASFILYAFIYMARYSEFGDTFDEAQHLSATLDRFRAVLLYLEAYPYPTGTPLAELCAPFWQSQPKPSGFLRRISRIASAVALRGNPFVWVTLNAVVPWDLYFAHRLQQYKEQMLERLPLWLERWYELEALNSLATFAYLNPHYTFPEMISSAAAGQPIFSARQLGHPLIPNDTRVENDFSFQECGHIALITGSNMSGKSTFLRTLGINLVLALSGAPVAAESLRSIPFRLFTSINVADSLNDGISYFYAEVRRLKALLVALESPDPVPMFFLIDEIFRGTNNRERQVGSQAYVQALAGQRGVGAISTHDLELTHLADQIPTITNYHFREDVRDERLVFDYRLRPGPCPTTNALKIMALEGLPVQPQ